MSTFFSFYQNFEGIFSSQWITKFLRRLKENDAHTISIPNAIQSEFNTTSRSNWKHLFEVTFSKNFTDTIRLFALDFYEVIVNYHFIEISNS